MMCLNEAGKSLFTSKFGRFFLCSISEKRMHKGDTDENYTIEVSVSVIIRRRKKMYLSKCYSRK